MVAWPPMPVSRLVPVDARGLTFPPAGIGAGCGDQGNQEYQGNQEGDGDEQAAPQNPVSRAAVTSSPSRGGTHALPPIWRSAKSATARSSNSERDSFGCRK